MRKMKAVYKIISLFQNSLCCSLHRSTQTCHCGTTASWQTARQDWTAYHIK